MSAEVYTSISFSSKFLVGSFNQYRSQGSQCPVLPNYLTTTFRLQQWLTETFEQEFSFVRHIDILFSSNPKLLPDSRYMRKQEFIEAKRNFSHYWPSENIFPQTIFNMHGKIPVDDEFLKRIATAMHTRSSEELSNGLGVYKNRPPLPIILSFLPSYFKKRHTDPLKW